MMKLTAQDLKEFGVIDDIIPEPIGGAHLNHKVVFKATTARSRRSLTNTSR